MVKRKWKLTTTTISCCCLDCTNPSHGCFPTCKHHLRVESSSSRFRWTPPHIGLETLSTQVRYIHTIFDLSQITESHLTQGNNSKVPLMCKICNYKWNPTINSVIYHGTGCPDCTGNVTYTLERLLQKAEVLGRTSTIDFSLVTKSDIIKGCKSNIPLRCKKCSYQWESTIDSVINNNTRCPDCTGHVPYTLDRLLQKAQDLKRTEMIDFSQVTRFDIINGSKSNIPLICYKCKYQWRPTINSVISGNTGCPDCTGHAPYTLERFLKKVEELQKTDTIDFNQVTESHITEGTKSHIPLTCKTCTYHWRPTIGCVIHGGHGCPDCAGRVSYTLERLLQKAHTLKRTDTIDFSRVTESHITEGNNSKIPLTCYKCKYQWEPTINSVINGNKGCPDCTGHVPYTLERFLKKVEELQKTDTIDFSQVTESHITEGVHSHIPLTCKKCSHQWRPTIHSVINGGHGCPDCADRVPYTLERVLQKAETLKRTDMIDFSRVNDSVITKGCYSHIPLTCKKCGHRWEPTINSVINHNTGCPRCRRSKMEEHTQKVLRVIQSTSSLDPRHWTLRAFQPQFRLQGTQYRPGSKGTPKEVLRTDFMLKVRDGEGHERTVILELDGHQHFKPVQFGGTTDLQAHERFLKQQRDDHHKDEHCRQKGWFMFRISYSVPLGEFETHLRYMLTTCFGSSGIITKKNIVRICHGDEYSSK